MDHGGRPIAPPPTRSEMLRVRVNEVELARWKLAAQIEGRSVSELIRAATADRADRPSRRLATRRAAGPSGPAGQ